ncbi:MAG: ABC transporter permease [Longimicrobiales bacterium]
MVRHRWRWFVRHVLHRTTAADELDAEIGTHLALETERRIDAGDSPEEAQRAARKEFGNILLVKDVTRDMWRWGFVEGTWHDARYGARMLRKHPGFTSIAVLSLAIGIGANTAIFSVVNAVLLRPPVGVDAPDELVSIYTSDFSGPRFGASSYPDIVEFRDQTDAFQDVMAFTMAPLGLTTEAGSRPLLAELVTGNYFDVLGMTAALGRTFVPEETRLGQAARVVVLSHGLWTGQFGADPTIVDRTLRLDGQSFTVVGVAPQGVGSRLISGVQVDVWVPLGIPGEVAGDTPEDLDRRGNRGLFVMARLRDGVTVEQTQAQLNVLASRLLAEYPQAWTDVRNEGRVVTVVPERGSRVLPQVRGAVVGFMTLLMVVVGLVLLVACSNIANLLLAKASKRRRDVAVRLALGCSRGRLVRQLLTESVLLAGLGGVGGVVLAYCVTNALSAFQPPLPISVTLDLGLDGRVLAFAAALSLASGVAFGLLPALQASRSGLIPALKDEGASNEAGRRWLSFRNLLVVGQVAVSLVLVVGAGLFLRSLQGASEIDIGFDPGNVAVMTVNLSPLGLSPEAGLAFYRDLSERLSAVGGVEAVSLARGVPLGLSSSRRGVTVEGYEPRPGEDMEFNFNVVSPGYFEMLRMPLVRGRTFSEIDREGAAPVVMVNEAFARRFWPAEDAIGKRVGVRGGMAQVIGVVRDGKYVTLGEEARLHYWQPFPQAYGPRTVIHVRASRDVRVLLPVLLSEVTNFDDRVLILNLALMEEVTSVSLLPQRAASALLGFAGGLSLFLAVIGVYGVMAYVVSQRTRELAIRIALGAEPGEVIWMTVRQGLVLAGVGLAAGLVVVFVVTRLIATLLYGISPVDPLAIGGGAALLGLAVLGASVLPAWRAARVDPIAALRHE